MGQEQSQTTGTFYHITKEFGHGNYIYWWPAAGFGVQCTNEDNAKAQYNKELEDGGKYRLIRVQVKDNILENEEVLLSN